MIVEGYTMDLYCDGAPDCKNRTSRETGIELIPPLQVTGEHRTECRSIAKKRGWRFNDKTGTVFCPICAKAADQR